jgi:hypothetical protein
MSELSNVIRLPQPELCDYLNHRGFYIVHAIDLAKLRSIAEESDNPLYDAAFAGVESQNEVMYAADRRNPEAPYKGYKVLSTTVKAVVAGETLFRQELPVDSWHPGRRFKYAQEIEGWRNGRRVKQAQSNARKIVDAELKLLRVPTPLVESVNFSLR